MSPNDTQVGGNHYRKVEGEQHWDRVTRLQLTWCEGNATKYTERCRHKGSMRLDLEKAIQYLSKQLEQLDAGTVLPLNPSDPDFPQPPAPVRRGRRRTEG